MEIPNLNQERSQEMLLTYALDQNDFLQHQLFVASKAVRIKRQRTGVWLVLTGFTLFLSLLFHLSGNNTLLYTFLICGVLIFVFFPLYLRMHFKKQFEAFIVGAYKKRFGRPVNIRFADNVIEMCGIAGESKINLTQLENITETGDYFFLKLKIGGHIIIPKAKVDNIDGLRTVLRQYCDSLCLDFTEELNWKWK